MMNIVAGKHISADELWYPEDPVPVNERPDKEQNE